LHLKWNYPNPFCCLQGFFLSMLASLHQGQTVRCNLLFRCIHKGFCHPSCGCIWVTKKRNWFKAVGIYY
jgi:hypothetical protein